jgi:hypothetical protein
MRRQPVLPSMFFLAAAGLTSWLLAEDLRVQLTGVVTANGEDSSRASMSFADGAALTLPEDVEFMDGIELELKIPRAAQAAKGAFLLLIYKRVSPAPDPSVVSYSAERVAMLVIPAKVSENYQIPLRADHGIKAGPYAVSLPMVRPQDFPIVVRLMPAIKGLSPELEAAAFSLKAKPVLRDEGHVSLALSWEAGLDPGSPLTVAIDDREIKEYLKPISLKSGAHALRVSGPDVRDRFQSFSLERGQRLTLDVALEDVVPRLVLEYPEKTLVELDGKRLELASGAAMALSPGDHVVSFTVGDYSIQRKLSVRRGRTYRVALLVDVRVEEGE